MIDYEAAVSGKRKVSTRMTGYVRFVSDKGKPNFPLIGFLVHSGGEESGPFAWSLDGKCVEVGIESFDLIQEPEAIEFVEYFNLYSDRIQHMYLSNGYLKQEDAQRNAITGNGFIATVKVTTRIVDGKVTIHGESV